jgi:large subunit ribosomal protein L4
MEMVKAPYFKIDGKKGRARQLPEALFDGVVNEPVLHQVVKAYLSNQRQGTAAGKNRAAVRGGSRKPWRQKGTGRARQGTIRAPQWTGGGLAFPPQPHGWRQQVPRKVKALARRSALNARAAGERILMVDALEFEQPKTKQVTGLLGAMGIEGKVLILTDGVRENLVLSARNLGEVRVLPFGTESPYDILWAAAVIIERPALERWESENGAVATEDADVSPAEATAGAAATVGDPTEADDTGAAEAIDAKEEEATDA